MKTVTERITTLTVVRAEAARLAAILSDVTNGAVTMKHTPSAPAHPLHYLWVWMDAVAGGHGGMGGTSETPHTTTINASDMEALHEAVGQYMRDRKVSALDDVDVAVVRGLLFGNR